MSHTPYDKSAPKGYCKPEDEHGLDEHDGHTNPVDLDEEPVLCPDADSKDQTSSVKHGNKKIQKILLRIPPRRLAFCGGGVRCVAHVGVLKSLDKHGLLTAVKEVTGISAGALFSLMFVLGYTLGQMEQLALDMDFTLLGNIDPEDVLLFPLTFGLNSGDGIVKLICSILRQKGFSHDITLGELAKKVPIKFRCYATELQKTKIKELSSVRTPNMKVTTAVRASMSFPIMYSPVEDCGSLLVDGGLLHNLPLVFLTPDELKETLGVFFMVEPKHVSEPVNGILDLFKYIYDAAIFMRNTPYLKKFKDNLIVVNTDEFNGLNFGETRDARAGLIESALHTTDLFLLKRNMPSRRFSVS